MKKMKMKKNIVEVIRSSSCVLMVASLALGVGVAQAKPPAEMKGEKKIRVHTGPEGAPADPAGDPRPLYAEPEVKPMKPEDVKGPHAIIKVESDTHDFGQTWVGPPLKHSFKITNAGDAPLEIARVKPSCGCTIAGDYPKTLAPGATGEFPFSMASNKLRGHFEKTISISSNDPVTPELRLKLKGEVKRFVEVTPPSVNFARITGQEPQERIVNLTNNTDTPVQLTLEQPADSKFKAELIEKTPGKQYDLRVSAVPPFEPGNLRSTITIKTNIPEQGEVTVDVNGIVPTRLEVQPSVILLTQGRGDDTTGTARVVRFTNYGDKPVKVLEATVDDPSVTVNVSERKAGESYTIQIQLPAGYQPSGAGAKLTLKTDDAEQPMIFVPIQGTPGIQQVKVGDTDAAKQPQPVEPPKPLIGNPAPEFKLTTIEGKEVSNATQKGQVTVLDFFAGNCGFCKKQIPRLETIRAEYADKGVRFVNVSQKMGAKEFTQEELVDQMKQLGFRGELALDHTNESGRKFQATGFPTMVIIDKEGKVATTNIGNVADLEERMKKQLDALIAGKPIPADAMAAAPQEQPKPAAGAGKPAPPIDIKTVDGKDLTNATFAQVPATVLDFFAVNCGYCMKQIPRLETLRKTYAEKGVRFVAVQQTMRQEFSLDDVKKKLSELGWGGEIALDPKNQYGGPFGANGFPTMVIVGKSGKIEAVNVGNIGDLETKVAGQLDALIAGKPIPADVAAAPQTPQTPPAGVGQPAPEMKLKTVDGKDLTNATFAQAPATVLDFFAVNCGYCMKQIPRLETVRKTYAGKGIRFVNVQQTMGKEFSEAEGRQKMTDLGWGGELALDPKNEHGPKFGARGFPTMVVVGKNGKIEAVNVGNIEDLESKLSAQLDAILAGKPASSAEAAAPPSAAPTPAAPPAGEAPKAEAAANQSPKRPAEMLVGTKAPSFALETVGGKPVKSDDVGKHPAVVLNFVAPNCGFCKRQVPNLEKVRAEYESKGVRFVNVAETMGNKNFEIDEIVSIFKEAGSNLEIAKDAGNAVGQMFKATSYPTMVIVGKDGTIEHVNVGAKPDIEQVVKTQLDALIARK